MYALPCWCSCRLGPWIESQHDSGGNWCCNVSDGRSVDARVTGDGHWQVHFLHPETLSTAKLPPEWADVPDDAVLHSANPTGVPIAWWYSGAVHCFVAASGT